LALMAAVVIAFVELSEDTMDSWPIVAFSICSASKCPSSRPPMAGPGTPELAMAVSDAGGFGLSALRGSSGSDARVSRVHRSAHETLNPISSVIPAGADAVRSLTWAHACAVHAELGLDPEAALAAAGRRPLDSDLRRSGRGRFGVVRARLRASQTAHRVGRRRGMTEELRLSGLVR